MRSVILVCSVMAASLALSLSAVAQQKTVKTCQAEWRANEAANKAKGITEKAYVAQCRSGGAAEAAPAAPTTKKETATPARTSPTTAAAAGQRKTVKACEAEWRANEAANKAKGITEKAYVTQCRAGGSAEAAPAAAAAAPTTSRTRAAPATTPSPQPTATANATPKTADEYSTEAQAKARCGAGTVVWADLKSKIYHFSGTRYYGHTKSGAYMCERDATSQGMRAAKNEKHP